MIYFKGIVSFILIMSLLCPYLSYLLFIIIYKGELIMVMMSKECFISQYKNESYVNLLKVRDKIIKDLKIYESKKNKINSGMIINPSPEAVYYMNLQYLAALCNLISKKFADKID